MPSPTDIEQVYATLCDDVTSAHETWRVWKDLYEVAEASDKAARYELLNQVPSFFSWLERTLIDHVAVVLSRLNDRTSDGVHLKKLLRQLERARTVTECQRFRDCIAAFSQSMAPVKAYRDQRVAHSAGAAVLGRAAIAPLTVQHIDDCICRAEECLDSAGLLLHPGTQRMHEPFWQGDGRAIIAAVTSSRTLGFLQILAWDAQQAQWILDALKSRTEVGSQQFSGRTGH